MPLSISRRRLLQFVAASAVVPAATASSADVPTLAPIEIGDTLMVTANQVGDLLVGHNGKMHPGMWDAEKMYPRTLVTDWWEASHFAWEYPGWHPYGRTVAFALGSDAHGGIYEMNRRDSTLRQLTSTETVPGPIAADDDVQVDSMPQWETRDALLFVRGSRAAGKESTTIMRVNTRSGIEDAVLVVSTDRMDAITSPLGFGAGGGLVYVHTNSHRRSTIMTLKRNHEPETLVSSDAVAHENLDAHFYLRNSGSMMQLHVIERAWGGDGSSPYWLVNPRADVPWQPMAEVFALQPDQRFLAAPVIHQTEWLIAAVVAPGGKIFVADREGTRLVARLEGLSSEDVRCFWGGDWLFVSSPGTLWPLEVR